MTNLLFISAVWSLGSDLNFHFPVPQYTQTDGCTRITAWDLSDKPQMETTYRTVAVPISQALVGALMTLSTSAGTLADSLNAPMEIMTETVVDAATMSPSWHMKLRYYGKISTFERTAQLSCGIQAAHTSLIAIRQKHRQEPWSTLAGISRKTYDHWNWSRWWGFWRACSGPHTSRIYSSLII